MAVWQIQEAKARLSEVIARGLTLVTRNTRDVAATGVSLFDPWCAQ
jgi:hypothetical protein